MNDENKNVTEIKITQDNLLAATRLANETRILAQKNAATMSLNGQIAECEARIKAAQQCIEAETRTKQALISQAQANVAEAMTRQAKRDKLLKNDFQVEDNGTIMGLDLDMEIEDRREELGEEVLGLLSIMRAPKTPQAPKPDVHIVKGQENVDRSLDSSSAKYGKKRK